MQKVTEMLFPEADTFILSAEYITLCVLHAKVYRTLWQVKTGHQPKAVLVKDTQGLRVCKLCADATFWLILLSNIIRYYQC